MVSTGECGSELSECESSRNRQVYGREAAVERVHLSIIIIHRLCQDWAEKKLFEFPITLWREKGKFELTAISREFSFLYYSLSNVVRGYRRRDPHDLPRDGRTHCAISLWIPRG